MTESEIKVSVIIPVYNVEKYLKQNLKSITEQTLKEIEIICVDDGSTDSSYKIIEDFAKKRQPCYSRKAEKRRSRRGKKQRSAQGKGQISLLP